MPLVEAGRAFYRQKERNPKSQFQASPRKRQVAFSRGPVEGEILVTEWPNRSRRLRWVKEKKNKNWCLATH